MIKLSSSFGKKIAVRWCVFLEISSKYEVKICTLRWVKMTGKSSIEGIKNSTKMFAILKSIDLYGFQNDAMKKRQWADLWS